jgi:hypothetical protein
MRLEGVLRAVPGRLPEAGIDSTNDVRYRRITGGGSSVEARGADGMRGVLSG